MSTTGLISTDPVRAQPRTDAGQAGVSDHDGFAGRDAPHGSRSGEVTRHVGRQGADVPNNPVGICMSRYGGFSDGHSNRRASPRHGAPGFSSSQQPKGMMKSYR